MNYEQEEIYNGLITVLAFISQTEKYELCEEKFTDVFTVEEIENDLYPDIRDYLKAVSVIFYVESLPYLNDETDWNRIGNLLGYVACGSGISFSDDNLPFHNVLNSLAEKHNSIEHMILFDLPFITN